MDKDEQLRLTTLDFAIKSGTGNEYNEYGALTGNAEKFIEAAEKYYNFMKGTKNDRPNYSLDGL